MREGQFIKRNLPKWESYQESTDDPDEVAKRFTNLVDDLSYAKTFYPGSNIIRYINSIAANIFLTIYRNKKEKQNRIITFWTDELPLVIYKYRKVLLYTLTFFVGCILLGALSAYTDQSFVRSVIGDEYVDMTEQNIAEGHPFAVYNTGNELTMFVEIAFNNIKVSFLTYVTGLMLGIGTLYFLFHNGVMVGCFEYLFFHHGLGVKSVLVVFIHGTLELWSIVVAGSAGFILGNAILFPKTYTRLQSLKMGAKDSIKIIVSLVPAFIIAAFFEGFVTRHTGMPIVLSSGILITSATFIIWYYFLFPRKKYKLKNP